MSLLMRGMPRRPYNAPAPLTTPTYEGSGQAVHPSVVDMGAGGWNGYRFWMAMTPYPNSNAGYENPSILASHDGIAWEVPSGLTNPIDPAPSHPTGGYNSDTELVYDPDGDRLVCYWRDYLGGTDIPDNLIFCYSQSTDGVTWTAQTDSFVSTYPDDTAIFSPTIARVGAGDWRMWVYGDSNPTEMRTATSVTGPWSEGTACTFNGTTVPPKALWHGAVTIDGDGVFRMIVHTRRYSASINHMHAASSSDGLAWSINLDIMWNGDAGKWDGFELYRPTMVIRAGRARVWYTGINMAGGAWHIGYTELPMSEWPAPPAPIG